MEKYFIITRTDPRVPREKRVEEIIWVTRIRPLGEGVTGEKWDGEKWVKFSQVLNNSTGLGGDNPYTPVTKEQAEKLIAGGTVWDMKLQT